MNKNNVKEKYEDMIKESHKLKVYDDMSSDSSLSENTPVNNRMKANGFKILI